MLPKAPNNDFPGRYREIVSDPINIAIEREPKSGYMLDGKVHLHNGLMVPVVGPHAYYGNFSAILVINRGVHEPLEEFIFQEMLKSLPKAPTMLELGAYWGHYSMWLQKVHPKADCHLVEPEKINLEAGQQNFKENNFTGKFTHAFVGKGKFSVDNYIKQNKIKKLDVLHSDIQGYEVEMLHDCKKAFKNRMIDRVFVSTHSNDLHHASLEALESNGYKVEVSSDYDDETTSNDGIIFASNPDIEPLFTDFKPLGRIEIANASPSELADYVATITQKIRK
jgi:hypothetical protein